MEEDETEKKTTGDGEEGEGGEEKEGGQEEEREEEERKISGFQIK